MLDPIACFRLAEGAMKHSFATLLIVLLPIGCSEGDNGSGRREPGGSSVEVNSRSDTDPQKLAVAYVRARLDGADVVQGAGVFVDAPIALRKYSATWIPDVEGEKLLTVEPVTMPASEESPGSELDALTAEDMEVLKEYTFGEDPYLSFTYKLKISLASGESVAAYVTVMKAGGLWKVVPSR